MFATPRADSRNINSPRALLARHRRKTQKRRKRSRSVGGSFGRKKISVLRKDDEYLMRIIAWKKKIAGKFSNSLEAMTEIVAPQKKGISRKRAKRHITENLGVIEKYVDAIMELKKIHKDDETHRIVNESIERRCENLVKERIGLHDKIKTLQKLEQQHRFEAKFLREQLIKAKVILGEKGEGIRLNPPRQKVKIKLNHVVKSKWNKHTISSWSRETTNITEFHPPESPNKKKKKVKEIGVEKYLHLVRSPRWKKVSKEYEKVAKGEKKYGNTPIKAVKEEERKVLGIKVPKKMPEIDYKTVKKTPSTPKSPISPSTPKSPISPSTPRTPRTPKTPKTPTTPKSPKTPRSKKKGSAKKKKSVKKKSVKKKKTKKRKTKKKEKKPVAKKLDLDQKEDDDDSKKDDENGDKVESKDDDDDGAREEEEKEPVVEKEIEQENEQEVGENSESIVEESESPPVAVVNQEAEVAEVEEEVKSAPEEENTVEETTEPVDEEAEEKKRLEEEKRKKEEEEEKKKLEEEEEERKKQEDESRRKREEELERKKLELQEELARKRKLLEEEIARKKKAKQEENDRKRKEEEEEERKRKEGLKRLEEEEKERKGKLERLRKKMEEKKAEKKRIEKERVEKEKEEKERLEKEKLEKEQQEQQQQLENQKSQETTENNEQQAEDPVVVVETKPEEPVTETKPDNAVTPDITTTPTTPIQSQENEEKQTSSLEEERRPPEIKMPFQPTEPSSPTGGVQLQIPSMNGPVSAPVRSQTTDDLPHPRLSRVGGNIGGNSVSSPNLPLPIVRTRQASSPMTMINPHGSNPKPVFNMPVSPNVMMGGRMQVAFPPRSSGNPGGNSPPVMVGPPIPKFNRAISAPGGLAPLGGRVRSRSMFVGGGSPMNRGRGRGGFMMRGRGRAPGMMGTSRPAMGGGGASTSSRSSILEKMNRRRNRRGGGDQ